MKNQNDLEKKKAQTQKKALSCYRRTMMRIRDRAEHILRAYPDSMTAKENIEDCEAALRAERKLYQRLQLSVTELPQGQRIFEIEVE